VKEEEKTQFEKDLTRLNNGIANIQKLRNAEMAEHLKKPHLSSTLCPFCNAIRNKLEEDLAPLLRQKEQVMNKLNEVERLRLATVSSKVKMSRIRE
jgi:phage-related tail protein